MDKEKASLSKNISQGGICIIGYELLRTLDILELKIFLPEDKAPLNAVGKVIWIKEFIIGDDSKGKRFDLGIEFIKINEQDLDKINKYVFSHK